MEIIKWLESEVELRIDREILIACIIVILFVGFLIGFTIGSVTK